MARRSVTVGDVSLHAQYWALPRGGVSEEELVPSRSPYEGIAGRRTRYRGHPALEYDYRADSTWVAGRIVGAQGFSVTTEARWRAPESEADAHAFLDSLRFEVTR
jgi:hypothetical protein